MSNNLSTIKNQFELTFPVDFVSNDIENRYIGYVKAKGKLHNSVRDYLNSTIFDISFPSITFNTISNPQNKHRKKIHWKSTDNIYDLFEDTATLTISNVDSNINYFMFLDVLSAKYLNTDYAYDENIIVTIIDENRNALYNIEFRDIIWTHLDGISLAFNQKTMENNTFTMTFKYNYLDVNWIMGNTFNVPDNMK